MPNDPGVLVEVSLEDDKRSASLLQELDKWHQFWANFLEGDNETLWQNVFDTHQIEDIRKSWNNLGFFYKAYEIEQLNEPTCERIESEINNAKQLCEELFSTILVLLSESDIPSQKSNSPIKNKRKFIITNLKTIQESARSIFEWKQNLSNKLEEIENQISLIKEKILNELNPDLIELIIDCTIGYYSESIFGDNGKLVKARTELNRKNITSPKNLTEQINILIWIKTSLDREFIQKESPEILENPKVQNLIAQRKTLNNVEQKLKALEAKMNAESPQAITREEINEIPDLLVQLPRKRAIALPSKLQKSPATTDVLVHNPNLSQSTRLENTSERQRNSLQLVAPTGQLRRSKSMYSFSPFERMDPVIFYCSEENKILASWSQDIELRMKIVSFHQILCEENNLILEIEEKLENIKFFVANRWDTIHTMPQDMLDRRENLQQLRRDINALLNEEGLITIVAKGLGTLDEIHNSSELQHSQLPIQNKENIDLLDSDRSPLQKRSLKLLEKYKELTRRFETLRTVFNQQRFRIEYMFAFILDKLFALQLTAEELKNSGNQVIRQLKAQKWFFTLLDETKGNNPDPLYPIKKIVAEFFTNVIHISIPFIKLTIKGMQIIENGNTKKIVLENGDIEESKEIDRKKQVTQQTIHHFFDVITITCVLENGGLEFRNLDCSNNPYIGALLLLKSQICDEGLVLFNEVTESRQNIAIEFGKGFIVGDMNEQIKSFKEKLLTLPLFDATPELKYLIDELKPIIEEEKNLELKCLELYLYMRMAIDAVYKYVTMPLNSIRSVFPKKDRVNLTIDGLELRNIPSNIEIPAALETLVTHLAQVRKIQGYVPQELNTELNHALRSKKQQVMTCIETLKKMLFSNGYQHTEFVKQLNKANDALSNLKRFSESLKDANRIIVLNKYSFTIQINAVDVDDLEAHINNLRLQYEIRKINQNALQVADRTMANFSENFTNLLPFLKSEELETPIRDYLKTSILLMSPQKLFEFLAHFNPQIIFTRVNLTKVASPNSSLRATHGYFFDLGDSEKLTKEVTYVVDWLSLAEQPYLEKIVIAIKIVENRKIVELLQNYLRDNENSTSLEKAKQFVAEIISRLTPSLPQDKFFDLFNHMTQQDLRQTFLEKSESNITYFLLKAFIEQGYKNKEAFIECVKGVVGSFRLKVRSKRMTISLDKNQYKFESSMNEDSVTLFQRVCSLHNDSLNEVIEIFQETSHHLYNLLLKENNHIAPLFANLRRTLSNKHFSTFESVYTPFNIIILHTLSAVIISTMQDYANQVDIKPYIYILAEVIKYCGIIGVPDSTMRLPMQLTLLVKHNEDFIKGVYEKFVLNDDEVTKFLSERLHQSLQQIPYISIQQQRDPILY